MKKIIPRLLFFLILLTPLIFNPFGQSVSIEPVKSAWFIFTTAIFVLYFGIKSFFENKITYFKNRTIIILILLWSLSFFISTIFALSPIESFFGEYQRLQGTVSHISYLIYFFSLLIFLKEEDNLKFTVNAVILISVPISILAILQKFHLDPFFPIIDDFTGRSFASLGLPTSLGQYLIFPLSLIIFELKDRLHNRRLTPSILYTLLLLVTSVALIFTINRASILGLLAAALIFLIFSIKNRLLKITLPVLGVIAIILSLWAVSGSTRSLNVREVLFESGISAISYSPLIGNGPESTYQILQKTISPELFNLETISDIPDRTHNVLLETILTRGILGLIILLFTLYYIVKTSINTPKSPYKSAALFALIAYFISVNFSFSLTSHIILLLTFTAIIFSPLLKWRNIKLSGISRFATLTAGSLIFLIAGTFSLRLLITDNYLSRGIENFFFSKNESMENFLVATDSSPYFAYPYRTAIILLGSYTDQIPSSFIDQQIEDLGWVTDFNFYYQLERGKFLSRISPPEAESYFNNAVKLAPLWPVIWMEWGESLYNNGNYSSAIEKFEHTINLVPQTWKITPETPDQEDRLRLFRKNNLSFYYALNLLRESYNKIGDTKKSQFIAQFLK